MKRRLYQMLAQAIDARLRCEREGNTLWFGKHTEFIEFLAKNYLPGGSGIDSGTKVDLDRSTGEKIVLITSYHHMNEGGMYDGWTDHNVIVKPSLMFGIELRITGRNRNDIKDYLYDTYSYALEQEIEESAVREKVEDK